MAKKRTRRLSASAATGADEEVVVSEEVVSSAKRRRASKAKRKRSGRSEAAEEGDGAAAAHTPQRTPEGRTSSDGGNHKKATPTSSGASDDPFNTAASAAQLGLDIAEDDDDATGATAAATDASASDSTSAESQGALTTERSWFELTSDRIVRLGRGTEARAARVLLRLKDAEFVVLEGFYRVRVLHGNVSIGAYTLGPTDAWQPVYAAATSAHYIQAIGEGYRAGSMASGGEQTVENNAASELWNLAPQQRGAVIALESAMADSLPASDALEHATKDLVRVLPSAEGRELRELGLGLELCRLVPPPSPPSSPSKQHDSWSGKPSKTTPTIATPEWEHAISNVSRMHRLALASRNANAVAPIAIAVGTKNAGKSTLCQLLLNSLLAQRADGGAMHPSSNQAAEKGERGAGGIVAYLDLDPGQCEFTAAGMISLVVVLDRNLYPAPTTSHSPPQQQLEIPEALRHLDEHLPRGPVLGPSHTHLHHATVRSCFIGSMSVDSDPAGYQTAIESLISGYRLLCDAMSPLALPLVVNTMGWVRGLGLQLLTQAIEQLRPTFLLALSSPQRQQHQQDQATTPGGGTNPYIGATSGEESDDANPASISGVTASSDDRAVTHCTTPAAAGSPKSKSRLKPTADERDMIAFRMLAKQTKASFLPLPSGGRNGSGSTSQGKAGRVLAAVELRTLALLAYFRTPSACSRYPTTVNARMSSGHSLSQWLPPSNLRAAAASGAHVQRPLIEQTPYAIRWCDVRIGFTHDRPPNSQALVALNGSLVGLVIDHTQYIPGPGLARDIAISAQNQRAAVDAAAQQASAYGFPGILGQAPAHCADAHSSNLAGATRFPAPTHCVGLGIVCRIDPTTKQIFVITPIPHAALAQVNTLLKGSIEVPALMRSYDAAIAMQQWQKQKQSPTGHACGGSVTPYYVLGAVASEGVGGGAMKSRNNLERGSGGK